MLLKYASGEIALMTLYETEISFSKLLTYPAVRPTHVNQGVSDTPQDNDAHHEQFARAPTRENRFPQNK